jgi:hypothetical protein
MQKVRKRNFGGFNSTLKGNITRKIIIDKFNFWNCSKVPLIAIIDSTQK